MLSVGSLSTSRSSPPVRGAFRNNLNKQTYSVYVETPRGRRKWHLSTFFTSSFYSGRLANNSISSAYVVAYFTQDSLDSLRTIDDLPQLASLTVPPGKYRTARSVRPNRAHYQGFDVLPSSTGYLTSKNPQSRRLSHGPENQAVVDHVRSNYPELRHFTGLGSRPGTLYGADDLAPLAYLQNIPPPRRHPLDEKALMSFTTELLR